MVFLYLIFALSVAICVKSFRSTFVLWYFVLDHSTVYLFEFLFNPGPAKPGYSLHLQIV